ncbi:MAG: tetratricopeptide repeat protein [Bacteroidota bacterium]
MKQTPGKKQKQASTAHSRTPQNKPLKTDSWQPWVIVFFLLIVTFALYVPSLSNRFTNWDDDDYVTDNPYVKQLSVQNAKYLFTHESAGNYHPLTMLSLGLDYQRATRSNPAGNSPDTVDSSVFHTTNLVLHLFNIVLVFIFIYLLTGKRLVIASVTALLFAIHPIHVESIAWIAERKDVLYTLFFMGALIAYLKYIENQRFLTLLLAGLLFLASLFSKPAAVVFPLVLLAVDYFKERKLTKRLIFEKIPFFILAFLFGAITFLIQSHKGVAGIHVFNLFQRFLFACYGFVMYQFKILVPLGLSPFYPLPLVNPSGTLPVIFYLTLPVALIMIAGIYISSRHTKIVSFGYLFYLFSILLVLQFLTVGSAVMADRYAYVSAIGLFFIPAWYLDRALTGKTRLNRLFRVSLAGLFIIYSIFLATVTMRQSMVWQDSGTLWSRVISLYPESAFAYKNRGCFYATINNNDGALNDFVACIRIKQDDAEVYTNLGNIYGARGNTEKALDAYSKSIAIDSLKPKTYLNRALTYSRAQLFMPALSDYNMALRLNPGLIQVFSDRGAVLRSLGRYGEAIADLTRAVQYTPQNESLFLQRGVCHFQLKEFSEALADFEQCVSLNPADGNAFYNLSAAYNKLNDHQEAYKFALKAASLNYPVDKGYLESLRLKAG